MGASSACSALFRRPISLHINKAEVSLPLPRSITAMTCHAEIDTSPDNLSGRLHISFHCLLQQHVSILQDCSPWQIVESIILLFILSLYFPRFRLRLHSGGNHSATCRFPSDCACRARLIQNSAWVALGRLDSMFARSTSFPCDSKAGLPNCTGRFAETEPTHHRSP